VASMQKTSEIDDITNKIRDMRFETAKVLDEHQREIEQVQSIRSCLASSCINISNMVNKHNQGVASLFPANAHLGAKRKLEKNDVSSFVIDVKLPMDLLSNSESLVGDVQPTAELSSTSLGIVTPDIDGCHQIMNMSQLKELLQSQEKEHEALRQQLQRSRVLKIQLLAQIKKNSVILDQLIATNLRFKQEVQRIKGQIYDANAKKKRLCGQSSKDISTMAPSAGIVST